MALPFALRRSGFSIPRQTLHDSRCIFNFVPHSIHDTRALGYSCPRYVILQAVAYFLDLSQKLSLRALSTLHRYSRKRSVRIQRLHISLRVAISLGSVCFIRHVPNSLSVLRRELDLPRIHVLLEILKTVPKASANIVRNPVSIPDVLGVS